MQARDPEKILRRVNKALGSNLTLAALAKDWQKSNTSISQSRIPYFLIVGPEGKQRDDKENAITLYAYKPSKKLVLSGAVIGRRLNDRLTDGKNSMLNFGFAGGPALRDRVSKIAGKLSRPEMRVERLGRLLGEDLAVQHFLRRSTEDIVRNDVLLFGSGRLVLDIDSMQPRLARLMPKAYGTATSKDWEPFVRQAIAMGLL